MYSLTYPVFIIKRKMIGFCGQQLGIETFENCSILFKAKEGEIFNHMNTLSILRIKILI